jgi:hypothetical protein
MTKEKQYAYKIQINYKTGISMTAWYKSFTIVRDGRGGVDYSWEQLDQAVGPILIGSSDIESIWQLEAKEIEE